MPDMDASSFLRPAPHVFMLTSVLIANRGEIARRIMRTARRMGVRTIAVYSDADAHAPHVREADAAVRIGAAPAKESYLRAEAIIAAAKETGAAAIHPGYGFLSENADFAEAVIAAGLLWIGPRPNSIRAMGLKDAAKTLMAAAGVPVTPGYLGEDQSEQRLLKEAEALGFPVLIKAVAGGGGKGMRKVEKGKDFKAALASAKREAAGAFGDDRVLIETYVARPRHIEVQVFGDSHGNIVHMFERDCSLQRRHQKVIEEAPAPGMDEATRKAVTDAAVRAARAVNYENAGTVEFIADARDGLHADRIWFMEMNTRLQVEHPVTEEITGQDLVEWQLRVASGEALPLAQDEITMSGHAVEARLYAENPETGFLPSIGEIEWFYGPYLYDSDPNAVRLDSSVDGKGEVTAHYDPMIAKLIAWAPTRREAITRLREACAGTEIAPLKANAGFLAQCLSAPDVIAGGVDTNFIAANAEVLSAKPAPDDSIAAAAAFRLARNSAAAVKLGGVPATVEAKYSPWRKLDGFRLNAEPEARIRMRYGAERLVAAPRAGALHTTTLGDGEVVVFRAGHAFEFTLDIGDVSVDAATAGDGAIRAPMPGRIVAVNVKEGARVKAGEALIVLEAMKMEHTLTAPFDSKVVELNAKAGAQVSEGALLATLEAQ
jgi:3-methylcrotonyl-CoA carboxylase alpha subunit